MQTGVKHRLVSRPFVSDPNAKVSRAVKLQQEINGLEASLPCETEIEFLQATASEDDFQNFVVCVNALFDRLLQLKSELKSLRCSSHLAAEQKADRSRQLASQKQDSILGEWITREVRAHRAKVETEAAHRDKISRHASKLAALTQQARQQHDKNVNEKISRTLRNIDDWNHRILSLHSRAHHHSQPHTGHMTSDSMNLSTSSPEAAASHSNEDTDATLIVADLQEKQERRDIFRMLQRKRRENFLTRYPVHTSEMNRSATEYFERKDLHVQQRIEENRCRRSLELAKHARELADQNNQRAASAALRHETILAAKRENWTVKNNLVSFRHNTLREKKKQQNDDVNRMRICRSIELSYRPTSPEGTCNSVSLKQFSSPKSNSVSSEPEDLDERVALVADRMISRAVKIASSHNITHEAASKALP
mmetsp:Transcript_16848/g.19272  ORF Transcript_16848/g.19272 Transcript_16848/m.19272 type:complete len:423 (+) Transcript_16848:2-1270(+)